MNCGLRVTLRPMLKPLVTSSMVMGETPVMNRRSRPPPPASEEGVALVFERAQALQRGFTVAGDGGGGRAVAQAVPAVVAIHRG